MKKARMYVPAILLCSLFLVFAFLSGGSESFALANAASLSEEAVLSVMKEMWTANANTQSSTAQIDGAGLTSPLSQDVPDEERIADHEANEDAVAEDWAASLSIEDDVEEIIVATLLWARGGAANIFNAEFLARAAEGTETAVALGRFGYPDYNAAYLDALEAYVSLAYEESGCLHPVKTSEWHRIALAVLALGGDPTAFGEDADGNSIDLVADGTYDCLPASLWGEGIQAAISALITLDATATVIPDAAKYQREDIINYLLSSQKTDGGFSSGTSDSDPALTAMVLTALAPYANDETVYAAGKSVSAVIEAALTYLSQCQQKEGDFLSGDIPNAESTAEVITALCTLGIDPKTDPRFIKSGNSALDGLIRYYLNDRGAFVHSFVADSENATALPGKADAVATDSGRKALIAYYRFENGYRAYYDFTAEPGRSALELLSITRMIYTLPNEASLDDEALIFGVAANYNLLNAEDREKIINRLKLQKLLSQLAFIKWGEEDPDSWEISAEAKAIDAEIAEKIDPILITYEDTKMVNDLYQRYSALNYGDKIGMENNGDLILAKKIINGLAQNTVIKEVFELIAGKDVEYQVTGRIDGLYAYTITFNGKDITDPMDFDAGIIFTAENLERISLRAKTPYYISFAHSGAFPGAARVEIEVGVEDGVYLLYYYHASDDTFAKCGDVTVGNTILGFTVDEGGDYFLTTAEVKQNHWYLRCADFPNGVIPAVFFEEMQGQDITLVIEGETADGCTYSITFYGKDIDAPRDFNAGIAYDSPAAETILRLAENPFIVCFSQKGAFPGKAIADITGVALNDGAYRLYFFDEEALQVLFSQNVTVAEEETQFAVAGGGDYFIAAEAKVGSIAEEAVSGNVETGEVEEEDNGSLSPLWIIGGGILLLAGIVIFGSLLKNWQ